MTCRDQGSLSKWIHTRAVENDAAAETERWIGALPEPAAAVRFGELARNVVGLSATKWGVRQHRMIVESLGRSGRSLEPYPTDGGDNLTDESVVYVISSSEKPSAAPTFAAAAATAVLAAGIVRADTNDVASAEAAWLAEAVSAFELSQNEFVRLSARMMWLRDHATGATKTKRLLDEIPASLRTEAANTLERAFSSDAKVGSPRAPALKLALGKLATREAHQEHWRTCTLNRRGSGRAFLESASKPKVPRTKASLAKRYLTMADG